MAATSEEKVISRFYEAFARRDAAAMAQCYTSDVEFHDPAFGTLRGDRVPAMWSMLCRAGKDLQVRASRIAGSDGRGSAHWEADYTFATCRKVHNIVDAEFTFTNGKISRHIDRFDFARWAGQAFGPPGSLLGRTPVLPFAMQRLTRLQLARYQSRYPA